MIIQGHFVPAKLGRVFVSQFGDKQGSTAILCLPSITEELNLARAILAKQCQAFANKGHPSFIMDYYGSGDSEGEFEDASANQWLDDVISVGQWLVQQGYKNIILLGVRVGALLLATNQEKLHQALPIQAYILWKPVTNGKLFVNQLIRIKQANAMMSGEGEKINWRNEILSGNNTEVAGYLLTAGFIEQLENLSITHDTQWQAPTYWLELASSNVSPATKRIVEGVEEIMVHTMTTPAFWQVPEIFDLPELTELGLVLLSEIGS
ncbi:hypothetical protein HII17_15935 [Thalassotalea sp. M1531]|uniref:Hydrolase 2, exosortase A system-associated n=1 Tax=Thalassotalea algicola TaxID=2716224 RepID=A0A7Y0Q840_9GAMM|nr:hypothetical protein [Thalassotalea algicola]NMP33048.1 hypothetical protein [Thalassotalea algicola]